jgi:hypothetical protein
VPRNTATTAHLAAAYPFAVEAGLGVKGVCMGRNRLSGGGGFFFDLFEAHAQKMITAPNAVVTGAGGFGKSAMTKCYVWRASVLVDARRRRRLISIIDPKGEWVALGRALGLTVIDLQPGGPHRVNPLDPGPTGSALTPDDLARTQTPVVAALLSVIMDRPLTVGEDRLVGHALALVSQGRLTNPTLADVRHVLANPTENMAAQLDTDVAELRSRARDPLDACAKLLDQELRGMFDGPTTIDLDWDTTPGIVLNLSAVLEHPRALKLVMIAAAGWLQALMHGERGRLKLNVWDESYKALGIPAMVSYLQDAFKVGRQFGTANILIMHALSELRAQLDDGAAAVKQAEALLNTTPVKVFLHQNPEQVADLLTRYGVSAAEAQRLPELRPHEALWKIGEHTAWVEHFTWGAEVDFCDTNKVMRGTETG